MTDELAPKKRTVKAVLRIGEDVRFIHCFAQEWEKSDRSITSNLIALGDDGCVYKHSPKLGAWVPLSKRVLNGRKIQAKVTERVNKKFARGGGTF